MQKLINSELRYRRLFEAAQDGILILDARSGMIEDVNPYLIKMLGYSREEFVKKTLWEVGAFKDIEASKDAFEVLQDREYIRYEDLPLKTKDGRLIQVEFVSNVYLVGEKKVIQCDIRDITEHQRIITALQGNEKKYHDLINQSPDGYFIIELSGNILTANQAMCKELEFSEEEFLSMNIWDIIPEQYLYQYKERLLKVLRGESLKETTEYLVSGKDGGLHYVEVLSAPRYSGKDMVGFQGIARDITARKRAEEQIQRQLKHLSALRMIDVAITSSFDLHVILDVVLQQVLLRLGVDASVVLLFNPHLQTIEYAASSGLRSDVLHHTRLKLGEGYASQAVLARKTIHIPNLLETGSKLASILQLEHESFMDYYSVPLIAKGEVKGVLEIYQRSFISADREWLDFLEALAGQAAIAIDNAQLFENLQRSNAELERRVTERTAELERANKVKDEFLANMSHELRTPLTSILGFSESLLEQRLDPLSDRQQRSLKVIESSGGHLLALINDILDLSKIEAGKFDYYPQIIVVDELCRSSLAFIKEQAIKKSITVTYINEISFSKIYADPRRLKQILINLLINAVKFTPENGSVTLQVDTDLEQDLIQLSVIDNGIGIAPEDLQRLFQPFVQVDSGLNRHQEGTGLGLALVQKLTDLHGGSVEVESEVGKGSRFTINLAARQNEIAKLESPQSPPIFPVREQTGILSKASESGGVIILADNNLANLLAIGEYLESHRYEVILAHDGVEALAKAEANNPDIILLDIQMPVMDGLEATRQLRANPRFVDTPIIALTALAMPGDRERCLEAGASEYMSKPVSLKTLKKTIENLLQARFKD
jgi:PAS domain S-box-containing protein